ncbi:MAG: group II intron reverse transcriptase/maturase [Nitrospiraceae bacterium]|nr:group II intron reverse transcriptase/maturase [Nitrospiraceae bacterium]MDA8090008.1 group II intron reverse transcriptase/maturase [Nitrospiraceae bacterium]
MSKAKPYSISKYAVLEAFRKVKANGGAAGVDGQSIAEFEGALKDNLYKLWNRMSSGCYFPPPVRTVEIPKDNGGKRPLGIPTVADRIAQMVVKLYLEPKVEPYFHPDSYGYRPGKSAVEAIGVARQRCWQYDWVVDLDIKGFFDNLNHELVIRAVRKHTDCKWILLYIERWLKAPAQLEDGTLVGREKGTPQGGVISPLLANLFLHYAFDEWMRRTCPGIPFERYADDIIAHCVSQEQAEWLKAKIEERLSQCGLELNPQKTRIIHCTDGRRKGNNQNGKFDFLGYTFRPREAKSRDGRYFINFSPAVSDKSSKEICRVMRTWRINRCNGMSLSEIARFCNPILRGWINYYGQYRKSALHRVFRVFNNILIRWAMRKYRRFKFHKTRAAHWLKKIALQRPELFAHWEMGFRP